MWQHLLRETRSSPDNLEDDKQEVGEEENLANTRVEAETLAGLRMPGSIQGREKHNDDGKKTITPEDSQPPKKKTRCKEPLTKPMPKPLRRPKTPESETSEGGTNVDWGEASPSSSHKAAAKPQKPADVFVSSSAQSSSGRRGTDMSQAYRQRVASWSEASWM